MSRLLAAIAAVIVFFSFPAAASAHMIETNYVLDNLLEFQSTFSTGEPVQQATVQIYAPNNPDEPWIELTTDDDGRFAFMPDPTLPGEWDVHIRQGFHEDIWTVPVVETGEVDFNNISDAADSHPLIAHWPGSHGAGVAVALGAIGVVFTTRLGRRLR